MSHFRVLVSGTILGVVAILARSRLQAPETAQPGRAPPFSPGEIIDQSRSKLAGLRTEIQPLLAGLLLAAFEDGIPLIITDGFRSVTEQDRIYSQGRTEPGPIVTNARGGSSWHNYGLAADLAVLVNGRPTWPNDLPLWARIGAIGKALGLGWGGDFPTPDRPHFELRLPGVGPGKSAPGIA
jgi:peptidoglycan L-alanyl-D-glutamate endopeptidase CwlK